MLKKKQARLPNGRYAGKTQTKKSKKRTLRNHFAICYDDSGSMKHLAKKAQEQLNKWLAKIQREAEVNQQPTNMSLIYFGSRVQVICSHLSHTNIKPITYYNPCQNSTALFKGVELGIQTLDEVTALEQYDDSFVVITITDGGENSSGAAAIANAKRLMQEKQGQDNWTFIFLLPRGEKAKFCKAYQIPQGNVEEWDQTDEGVEVSTQSTELGIETFYRGRSVGLKSTKKFFVQPDLAALSTKELKKELTDISQRCRILTVPKEQRIRPFVMAETGSYKAGTVFYELMKTEDTVQPNKQVLIIERGKPAIYSGQEARDLIGLPYGITARVEPGNHGKYQIFIQSNSHTRILSRGTKVIVVDRAKV